MKAIQNQEGLLCLETETEKIITTISPDTLGIKEIVEGEIEAFDPVAIAQVEKLKHLPFELSEMAVNTLGKVNPEGYIYGTCNGGDQAVWDSKGQVFVILTGNNGGKKDSLKTIVEREPKPIPPEEPTELIVSPTKLSDYTEQITNLKSNIGRSFLEIGRLLCEVRAQKIYQESYPTFDSYLSDVFSQSRATAYALMQVYESNLDPELCLEIGWAKARELASLDAVTDLSEADKKEVIEAINKPEVSTVETKAIVAKVKKAKDKPVKEAILEAKKEIKEAKAKKVKAEKPSKDQAPVDLEKSELEPIDILGIETFEQERIAQLKTEIIEQVHRAKTVDDVDYIGGLLMDLRDFFENGMSK